MQPARIESSRGNHLSETERVCPIINVKVVQLERVLTVRRVINYGSSPASQWAASTNVIARLLRQKGVWQWNNKNCILATGTKSQAAPDSFEYILIVNLHTFLGK